MKNKVFFRLFFCLLIFFLFRASFAQAHRAVVGIYTDNGLGTGFFISNNGVIATAYHVIKGAKWIRVIDYKKSRYEDVKILKISGDYDLAILQILPYPKTYALNLKEFFPPTTANLKVIAYPRGIPNQEYNTHCTNREYLKSTQLNILNNEADIFEKDIDIILLALNAYRGMSGAPIIAEENKVIGVLSGSFTEVGSFAWVIPSKYFTSLKNVDKKPDEISEWEPVSLMKSHWRNLCRPYSVDLNAEKTYKNFYLDMERIKYINQISSKIYILQRSIDHFAISIRSSFQSIQELQSMHISTIEFINNGVQYNRGVIRSDRSYSNALKDYLRKRSTLYPRLRESVSKMKNWILASDIQEEKKNKISERLRRVEKEYYSLLSSDPENILEIDLNELSEKFKEFNEKAFIDFNSREEAQSMAELCESISVDLEKISNQHFYELITKETEMFEAYGQIFKKQFEYFLFKADH